MFTLLVAHKTSFYYFECNLINISFDGCYRTSDFQKSLVLMTVNNLMMRVEQAQTISSTQDIFQTMVDVERNNVEMGARITLVLIR
jgi:hypothetical protein